MLLVAPPSTVGKPVLSGSWPRWTSAPGSAKIRLVNYSVEHFRAVDAPSSPLGYDYVSTGRVEAVEAHDEASAAAIALAGAEELELDLVSYDPTRNLYGVAGEDEAVRVTAG